VLELGLSRSTNSSIFAMNPSIDRGPHHPGQRIPHQLGNQGQQHR
jgi:hypothetical protein